MYESNTVMSALKFNFGLPPEIVAEFNEIMGGNRKRKKGNVISAAVLLLLELPEAAREHLFKEVRIAAAEESYSDIIARAKNGQLRQSAQVAADKSPLRITIIRKDDPVKNLHRKAESVAKGK